MTDGQTPADCASLSQSIERWLSQRIYPIPELTFCMLRTPFRLPDGNILRLAIEPHMSESGMFVVSDYGAIADVFGQDAPQEVHSRIADVALRNGVTIMDDVLEIICEMQEVPQSFWRMVQVCLQASGLYRYRQLGPMPEPRIDVRLTKLVQDLELPLQGNYQIKGKIDDHSFDFGHKHNSHQVLIQTLQAATPIAALRQKKICCWDMSDVRAEYTTGIRSAIILDDSDPRRKQAVVKANVQGPLRRLHDAVLYWTDVSGDEQDVLREITLSASSNPQDLNLT